MVALAPIVLVAGLLTMQPGARGAGMDGEARIVRIVVASGFDAIDPALAFRPATVKLVDTTCARLMAYPDKPPPEGYRLVPEVAAAYPSVSRDGRTWTFTLRSGFRFSDGTPVRASAFAQAIARTLAPGVESDYAAYTGAIVGAEDFQTGRTASLPGVVAQGNRLVVRFKRPVADFPAQTAMTSFCAVPPNLPPNPEGVTEFPGAGPYYVAEYRPGQRVVIRRNRFYRGTRPHHVDGFYVDLTLLRSYRAALDRVERGEDDWGSLGPVIYAEHGPRLAAKYGIGRSRFFVTPGLIESGFSLNTSRPLFRDNPRLRRAVNFAIDRRALVGERGGPPFATPTDQYLLPGIPGFTDARIYPFTPDLAKARALARGHRRGGKVMLYTVDTPLDLARAQIVAQNLAKIGLDVDVKRIASDGYEDRLRARGEPYDIALYTWLADYIDPYNYINVLLDGRFIGSTNDSQFDSPTYNGRMRRASRLYGEARTRAYRQLDVQLARDAAPRVAVDRINAMTLVSRRLGCLVLRPDLVLTAVCLKE